MFIIHAEPRITIPVIRGSVFFMCYLIIIMAFPLFILLINPYICINHIKKIITIFSDIDRAASPQSIRFPFGSIERQIVGVLLFVGMGRIGVWKGLTCNYEKIFKRNRAGRLCRLPMFRLPESFGLFTPNCLFLVNR